MFFYMYTFKCTYINTYDICAECIHQTCRHQRSRTLEIAPWPRRLDFLICHTKKKISPESNGLLSIPRVPYGNCDGNLWFSSHLWATPYQNAIVQDRCIPSWMCPKQFVTSMNRWCESPAAAQTETWTMEDGWERVHPPCLDLRAENGVHLVVSGMKPSHGPVALQSGPGSVRVVLVCQIYNLNPNSEDWGCTGPAFWTSKELVVAL
jgi:hypothetical protein